MPAEEISPIQGFKTGPSIVDFRPISDEKRQEETQDAAPLGVPESVTSSPPDENPPQPPNTEGLLEEVASMERERLRKEGEPDWSQGSQQHEPATPVSAEKVSTPKAPQPPVIKPGS